MILLFLTILPYCQAERSKLVGIFFLIFGHRSDQLFSVSLVFI